MAGVLDGIRVIDFGQWIAGPLSALLLADGLLRLRELLDLRLPAARLVVLSACETAVAGTDLPDEVVSLAVGLVQAGAAGVVASAWAVPGLATALLMARFYANWAAGPATPAEALREAQQWIRDTTNDEKCAYLQNGGHGRLPAGPRFMAVTVCSPLCCSHSASS